MGVRKLVDALRYTNCVIPLPLPAAARCCFFARSVSIVLLCVYELVCILLSYAYIHTIYELVCIVLLASMHTLEYPYN